MEIKQASSWSLSARLGRVLVESKAREAHHAAIVDIPLLVVQQAAAGLRRGLQERVNRRGAAPLQVVVVFAHQLPETSGVALLHALNAFAVAPRDVRHLVLARVGVQRISVTPA